MSCNGYNHSPNCNCGWGGIYHGDFSQADWGNATDFQRVANPFVNYSTEYDNFCRLTECRDCKKQVYLVHHNGGYVLVEELGWPWPIHPCFLKNGIKERDLSAINKIKVLKDNFNLGYVPIPCVINAIYPIGEVTRLSLMHQDRGSNFTSEDRLYFEVKSKADFQLGDIILVEPEFNEISCNTNSKVEILKKLSFEEFNLPDIESLDFNITGNEIVRKDEHGLIDIIFPVSFKSSDENGKKISMFFSLSMMSDYLKAKFPNIKTKYQEEDFISQNIREMTSEESSLLSKRKEEYEEILHKVDSNLWPSVLLENFTDRLEKVFRINPKTRTIEFIGK